MWSVQSHLTTFGLQEKIAAVLDLDAARGDKGEPYRLWLSAGPNQEVVLESSLPAVVDQVHIPVRHSCEGTAEADQSAAGSSRTGHHAAVLRHRDLLRKSFR